jgi:hypothetical protein
MTVHQRPVVSRRVCSPSCVALAVLALTAGMALAVPGQAPAAAAQAAPVDPRLARVLERTKAYCAKLERAALDFTCLEKIEERTYSMTEEAPDVSIPQPGGMSYAYKSVKRPYYANTYVYDYQFIRKGPDKKESRILVEENGRKKKEREAVLTTMAVRVENALFGPIGLLGAAVQELHTYTIVGEEKDKGKTVLVIDAVSSVPLDRVHCTGRVWVREDDASILKIAWDQASVGNFQLIRETARRMGAEPKLTSMTEYGLEKGGLRFPSQDVTEEGYLKHGLVQVRSLTMILYKDYKFFTVETEVGY